MSSPIVPRSARRWAAKFTAALLAAFTVLLAWLWICSALDKPYRLNRSTDRYCSYIGFVRGSFLFHYDGGADQGIVTPRDWRFMGTFWKSGGGPTAWQHLEVGFHGRFAIAFLCVAWTLAAWVFVGVPVLRRRRGRCVRCAYDVRNIPSLLCPECGLHIPSKQATHPARPARGGTSDSGSA